MAKNKGQDDELDIKINEPYVFEGQGQSYFDLGPQKPEGKGLRIKDLDDSDRPMEKLRFSGPEALNDAELLAILIGSGTKDESAIDLAYQVLIKAGNNENLMDISVEELMEVKGIGQSKACRIIAGLELGRRIKARPSMRKFKVSSPKDVFDLYEERFRYENVEYFFILLLDTKNFIVGEAVVSKGDLNKTIVNPREVFRVAIRRACNSIMLVHNHPSGDARPSDGDIKVTQRLVECGDILGIRVLDHIILGYNEFFSLRRENLM